MPAPVITATRLVHRIGATPNPIYSGTGAAGTINWTNNLGATFTFSNRANGQSTELLLSDLAAAYNRTKIGTVSASDTVGGTSIASLSIYATFPLQPHFGYEVDYDNKTLVSVAEDGTAVFRKKSSAKMSWTLQFPRRPLSERTILKAFWDYHEKTVEFYYYDLALNELRLVRFDSGIRVSPDNMNLINMSCVLREI
jgi:hypothetical protein